MALQTVRPMRAALGLEPVTDCVEKRSLTPKISDGAKRRPPAAPCSAKVLRL